MYTDYIEQLIKLQETQKDYKPFYDYLEREIQMLQTLTKRKEYNYYE